VNRLHPADIHNKAQRIKDGLLWSGLYYEVHCGPWHRSVYSSDCGADLPVPVRAGPIRDHSPVHSAPLTAARAGVRAQVLDREHPKAAQESSG